MGKYLVAVITLFQICFSSLPALAATELLTNGSFEAGLASWTIATNNEAGAAGTCGYNGAVAPGTETLTGLPGFPATDGTQIALGSVASTSGTANRVSCVLYQDINIPAGATTATFTFDIGTKGGVDGGVNTAAFVGLFSTASVPKILDATVAGNKITYAVAVADAALTGKTSTVNFNVAGIAGTTVRFAIINGANMNGNEVVGIDKVSFLVTVPPPAPTLNEWGMIIFSVLLALSGIVILRRQRNAS